MDILKNNPENENIIAEMRMRNALDYQLPLLYKWSLYMNEAEFPFELMKENFEHTQNVFLNYEKTPDIDPKTRFNYKRFYSYLDYENQRFKREYLKNYDPETKDSKADFVIWNLISAFDVRCVREHDLFIDEANKIGSYMLKYPMQPYLFIRENDPEEVKKEEILINEKIYKNEEEILYETMEGFPANNLVLLLDVSASMNTNDKIGLLKKSFIRLLKILREEDYVSIIIYSGDAQIILPPTSCTEKVKITEILNNLKTGGNTNIGEGLDLALKTASKNFIAGGNNRIILATDGEFSLDEKYFKKIEKLASKEIYFSVFQFKKEKYIDILSKMAQSGKGNYEILNTNNIAVKLIKEAKAIQQIKK
jgi:Mg-chelatase subunit ChlD